MHLQSILRRIQPLPGFVYDRAALRETRGHALEVDVHVRPRSGARAVCGNCGKKGPGYDTIGERRFAFVPLWGMAVFLFYAMRRVECRQCGVTVEMVPWASGKSPATHAYTWFLASWAKVLSWSETARRFRTTWDVVFRAVDHAVRWGLEHRNLDGIRSIGVDELSWKKGHKYLTLVYQIDHGCRRLLHIAKDRKAKSFHAFFDMLGEARSKTIAFVASDMWQAFRGVVQHRCSAALHVLDRFHVMQLMSKAIDETRRQEVRLLRAAGHAPLLTKTRWLLLKRPKNLRRRERGRLRDLVRINLRSVRAYLLKEHFQHFWSYKSVAGGHRFLLRWTDMAMRSRIEPIKKFARTLRDHKPELLNWFLARGQFAAGATEGFNNKARITTRKAYAFGPTNTPRSPCTTRSATYPSPTGSPTDSPDEAHFVVHPAKEEGIDLLEVLGRVAMQVFVWDRCTMIAAPVQRDVDGIPKGRVGSANEFWRVKGPPARARAS